MGGDIELIIFDLGGVLIEVDHDSAIDWLLSHGCKVTAIDEFVERTGLPEHERGELAGDAFLQRVNAMLSRPQSLAALHQWWTGFFRADEQMLDLARQLRRRHRVCVLSNTGPLHWAQALKQFDLDTRVDGALTSYSAGVAKPDPRIFARAQRAFDAVPARTVFIDDLSANVAGAVKAGWHAIHHRDVASTRAGLRDLGVALD